MLQCDVCVDTAVQRESVEMRGVLESVGDELIPSTPLLCVSCLLYCHHGVDCDFMSVYKHTHTTHTHTHTHNGYTGNAATRLSTATQSSGETREPHHGNKQHSHSSQWFQVILKPPTGGRETDQLKSTRHQSFTCKF